MSHPDAGRVTLIARREVFVNRRFTAYSDHIAGGGLEVEDYLVVAPHGQREDLLTGVAIVAARNGSILLLKNYRHAVQEAIWELPRGFIDQGEDAASAARRELAEETGLNCPISGLIALGMFLPEPGVIRARVALFAAVECVDGGARLDDELGIQGRVWHTEERVCGMLRDGTLQDGATCVALYRYFEAQPKKGISK